MYKQLDEAVSTDLQTIASLTTGSPSSHKVDAHEWAVVSTKKKKQIRKPTIVDIEGVNVMATPIDDIADATIPGELYYSKSQSSFAVIIAGYTLTGNVGNIFTSLDSAPIRVKECRYNCTKIGCGYYHPNKDIRNFTNAMFLYTPPSNTLRDKRTRNFGSREHLSRDIITVTADDKGRAGAILMHDLLCYLVMCGIV
jgi:hypothetical protein